MVHAWIFITLTCLGFLNGLIRFLTDMYRRSEVVVMLYTCGSTHVAVHMWQYTCGSTHVAVHMWQYTCGSIVILTQMS